MPKSTYNLSTKGEITLIDCDGVEWKLGEIIDFIIEDEMELVEHTSHRGVDLVMPISQTFNLHIVFGRIKITQPPKITKKTVRRKIRGE